ncbi:Calmodulin-binding domain [Macleaya cordata]|uniref:Calmodulin-binding domain n=1 Tax=Macleaya cordata TaxID=56857 RepID=A0A200QNY5_MACCD|nr:Calmodulin-binding domain [Macleaya cordata]
MAEGRIEVPKTPERTNPKDPKLRRNSTGKTSTSGSGGKILPHYLRASTNSCHEFCKYGRKHAFEEVGKRPVLKGIRSTLVESQKPVKTLTLVDRKKKPVIKPKPSPDQQVRVLETPKTIKKETTSVKKIDVPAKPAPAKLSSSPLNTSRGVMAKRNSDNKIIKIAGASKIGQKKAVVLPKVSLSPKPSANRVTSSNAKYKVPKTVSPPLKNQKNVTKDESNIPKEEKVREKTLYIIEPKLEDESLKLAHSLTSLPSPSTSSSPLSSPSLPLPERELEEDQHEGEIKEECVDSEYTIDDDNGTLSESDETEHGNQMETSNEEYKRRSRTKVQVEDEELAQKLNFRRGKVVNLQPENNAARRLRFNRGRVLGNNENGENDTRRRFRRREMGDGDRNSGKPESENVVLRHQDVQGKKDTQVLFNNVIEETASKLVEKRKSKVKALVGAFETVISLQESKAPATSIG